MFDLVVLDYDDIDIIIDNLEHWEGFCFWKDSIIQVWACHCRNSRYLRGKQGMGWKKTLNHKKVHLPAFSKRNYFDCVCSIQNLAIFEYWWYAGLVRHYTKDNNIYRFNFWFCCLFLIEEPILLPFSPTNFTTHWITALLRRAGGRTIPFSPLSPFFSSSNHHILPNSQILFLWEWRFFSFPSVHKNVTFEIQYSKHSLSQLWKAPSNLL